MNIPVVSSGAVGRIHRLADSDADTGTRTSGGGPLGGKTIATRPSKRRQCWKYSCGWGNTHGTPPTGRPPV